ncbi:carbohydrate ABC transporter permease [Murimonas intestini]|uniref:Raffinose/stachyose/melibiose transport system permease protein n=1 Tax=Murimonas intestini TaxID=1337051 RepID=A0AB73T436_9FIRM|nr:sugar ABC transporter permease [Murimonas intestini]MCR1840965.1 sugar ABC transporter permease [Murimonas intestini]MCR1865917.1 sugar ABC transporter permease [Murimonas intestini]MCR1883337.1 sugar ABC transporter permease [Murimonas intestini]
MKKNKKYWLNYGLFVGPILCSFFLFYLLPIILGIGYSLYDWNGISNAKKFVGLDNYIKLFTGDKNYFASLIFTFKYAFFSVILTNLLAMAFALWVTGRLKSSVWMRTCFFLPNVICAVVAGMLWKFILNQAVPQLGKITGISILGTKLLASPQTAWIAVLIVSLWQGAGYNMIIYIAGLLSIDKGYYESAAIDGAGRIQRFFKITLPLMMPSITICLFNTIAGAFRMFDMNLSLTDGGPGRATQGMALDVFKTAFSENRMGYGSAKAMILLIIVIAVTFIQTGFTKKREVEM